LVFKISNKCHNPDCEWFFLTKMAKALRHINSEGENGIFEAIGQVALEK
jgi:hypothetical protein